MTNHAWLITDDQIIIDITGDQFYGAWKSVYVGQEVGLVSYGDDNDEVFIGRDFGHTSRGYGEQVATTIDSEVKRIIDECYDRAKTIIKEHEAVLYKCADLLLEKEKITREEFEALFEE